MRLAADPAVAAWLEGLLGQPEDFEWDRGNLPKLAKHGVQEHEVVSIFRSPLVLAGRIIDPAHDEPRWLILGRSARGRRLALIVTRRGERLRPITCRAMRRRERRRYEEALRETDEGTP